MNEDDQDKAVELREHLRMTEAILFASERALSAEEIALRLPAGADVAACVEALRELYAGRGVELVAPGGRYMFRTAPDLAFLMRREVEETRRLSRAAIETLAIVAWHQPVTRAEIEEIRGVGLSKGTLDLLMEAGWVHPRGRKRTPGRPLMYGTTAGFLVHFGLDSLDDLPGINELKAAGMLDSVEDALARLAAAEEKEREAGAEDAQLDLIDEEEEPDTDGADAP